jgi:hypothetical protein
MRPAAPAAEIRTAPGADAGAAVREGATKADFPMFQRRVATRRLFAAAAATS